jgi:putative ABC transport system permease protein
MLYYGGIYGEVAGPQDTFPSFAADTVPELRGLWGEDLKVTDADWQTWYGDRTAALVGPQLMRKYGWSRGQRIVLRGTLRPVDLELVIAGPISVHTDHATVFLHREYLEEALGRPGLATMFWVQVDDAAAIAAVGARIDAELAASPAPTRSVSMKQLLQQVIGMLGDIRTAVTGIAVLVMLAVLFVALNAAALTARERTTEVALLKALGFTGRDVFFSMLVESVSVALAGGALGCAAAWALFRVYTLGLGFGPLSGFQVPAGAVPIGLAASALIGALAALLPGLRAARVPVVQALRRTS